MLSIKNMKKFKKASRQEAEVKWMVARIKSLEGPQ